ncbi:MAG: hypothetical protein LBC61_05440 [Candidatus Peribacteria bacterium]|nr:hypothetical protein [Candidatus Peribacteria bacterium]
MSKSHLKSSQYLLSFLKKTNNGIKVQSLFSTRTHLILIKFTLFLNFKKGICKTIILCLLFLNSFTKSNFLKYLAKTDKYSVLNLSVITTFILKELKNNAF